MANACKVLAGTLAPDPYTGTSIRFVNGGASEVATVDLLTQLNSHISMVRSPHRGLMIRGAEPFCDAYSDTDFRH